MSKKIEDIIHNKDINKGKHYHYQDSTYYKQPTPTRHPIGDKAIPIPGDKIWAYSKAFSSWVEGTVISFKLTTKDVYVNAPSYPFLGGRSGQELPENVKNNEETYRFLCQIYRFEKPEGEIHPLYDDVILTASSRL